MDVVGSLSVTHSCHARVAEVRTKGHQSVARTASTPRGSNLFRFTAFKFSESFSGELVESALCDVAFELAIPDLPVVLYEPITECSQFLRSELFDLALKSFNFGHVVQKFTTSSADSHIQRPTMSQTTS